MKNARFWIYWNEGFVKLTMRESDEINLFASSAHEEGWSSRYENYTYEDGVVMYHSVLDGRDCDGRLTHESLSTCHVDKLSSRDPYNEESEYCPEVGAKFPEWKRKDERQYDEYAVAAGY